MSVIKLKISQQHLNTIRGTGLSGKVCNKHGGLNQIFIFQWNKCVDIEEVMLTVNMNTQCFTKLHWNFCCV